ncbi:MAG: DNA-directed RNA polymerase subunit beta [Candidatus Spechtbacteria bacterium RIFCSPLOWO2_12_FULL_38_22]|uniref:DNA-directed RNA polymerase subunit beta n=1 Tax=Candidatus Spechtbacteria bacterium RIFCSPLOWO2_12_FULL_38_22 TaxID=1802165 RepID=A0A1G2HGG1_9BACT|nr:MAG: DNA-directed RNA polymerase subunit beta [Candidatus Spechtbacteria bacterium RIFCSPHIGHO2_12_FULL_38_30]OGZ60510.1 MAG: DNA-directed RNA polymerase subunit beta [Candidatus Spechtbacteria bacterium RIFCSPLOWO2_01_FULL_38_20]OGZ61360.1 MAG: DNA-directed RNA polymerase subunit beta [Candidatus Spechtbacteria bacterium RIFCSPLOWO2_12_FULL_38_22]
MLPVKVFSNHTYKEADLPNLLSIQKDSYRWFWDKGLRTLFDEISPVKDFSGKDLELYFGDYRLEDPKYTEVTARRQNASYEAALRVAVKLHNKKSGEVKEQEVYLGDFPIMTSRGTFIVNGVERVLISQLIRSPGVVFVSYMVRGVELFGSKVIPNRGAWLEFDVDHSGVIYVKVDRKRKITATTMLRLFGMTDLDIKKAFKKVDSNTDIKYIERTLKQDPSKTAEDAYLEIYKRVRPGDLATPDNAKSLIDNMFFNFDRYDLSNVGRWKSNQRLAETWEILGIKTPKASNTEYSTDERTLKKEDILGVMAEIIRMNNNPDAKADDIDHLGNRRIRSIGELLQNRLRVGLTRMERNTKDRMSTLDINTVTPIQLINARPVASIVKEFFTTGQLSQYMDETNPLSELEHKRILSATGPGGLTRERAGFEVRDVQPSHFGRICPIQTPEGPNVGIVTRLATYARINDLGFLETPYFVVENGQVTGKIEHLNALQEERSVIASSATRVDKSKKIVDRQVQARIRGVPTFVDRKEAKYLDVSPRQSISVATALIPFLEHDDANRAMMGSNMQRQAVPCIRPEAPLVGTGLEEKVARDSGLVLIAEKDGVVEESDGYHVSVRYKGAGSSKKGKTVYNLNNFVHSNQYTVIHQTPRVRPGDKIKQGDILADTSSVKDGVLSLGKNILVAFMPWRGGNFEDAVLINEKLVKEDILSSVHLEDFSMDIRETKLGPEVNTPDIPNVGQEKLKDLDEEGIIRIGAEVDENDILVGKITPKGEADLTSEERLLRAIFGEKARDVKDTSLRVPHGKRGRVVGVTIFSREDGDSNLPTGVIKRIQIDIAQLRKIEAGDKIAGRHGNKGVISRVLPQEDMPFMPDGTPVDIILNPLGVPSRMNIGQILETHLGFAAKTLGYRAVTPAFSGATEQDIKEELKKAGLPQDGKILLRDGRTGESFAQPVTVGYMYMLKLVHMVEDKIHMRSIGPYSLITQQPLGGKSQFGGQRFGEMEVWALEGYGAAHNLQEILTIKSDDVMGRSAAYESIIKGEEIKKPNIPESFNVLVNELKGLGLNVELEQDDS